MPCSELYRRFGENERASITLTPVAWLLTPEVGANRSVDIFGESTLLRFDFGEHPVVGCTVM